MKMKFGAMLPTVGLLAVGMLAEGILGAQTFDTSATGTLKGTYYLRQVLLSGVNTSTGAIGRARSVIGTATLDGAGNYSFTGTLMDSQGGSSQAFNATGTYAVSSNGLAKMRNPITGNATVNGGIGLGAFVGSTTESQTQDFLVMIPAGTAAVTNNSLQGSYRVGALEFLQASSGFVREAYFTLTSTGNGTLGNVSVNGSAANLGNTGLSQTVSGATYSLAQTPGTINFPPAGSIANTQLISGTKTLFVSADGNLLLGGSPGGFDMLIGIRGPNAGIQPTISGTFYVAGLEEDATTASNPAIDGFYGSLNGTGASGVNTWHERLNPVGEDTFDDTFASTVTLDATGAANKGVVHYDVGANGRALLIVGQGSQYTLALGLHTDDFTGTGVFLNPIGIANAAGFAPITNSVAPNEFLSLFGTGLAAGTQVAAASVPLPTTLGGVRVTVNGRFAPLFYVSANQINALVPSNLPEDYATIQVINNGVSSNAVTVYANNSSPAVFTQPPNGISSAAALHSNFSLVNTGSPARPGETILVYLTGLGAVSPTVADGAAAPSSPLSSTTSKTRVFFGTTEGTVNFSGLAPGFAGLYQLNVVVPSAPNGSQFLSVDTPDALNQESTILITGSTAGNAEKSAVADAPGDRGYRPALIRKSVENRASRTDGSRRNNDQ